ncbi:nuclear transport factor 2 family protein [Euzebya sp.]|uniref:nuclear transport factor 2 family protein n=1 Tax=Euzebya sp. TaxID=1971409 RepID=UPI003510DA77
MPTTPEESIRNAMAVYATAVDDREYDRLRHIFDADTTYVLTSRTCHGVDEAIDALTAALADHPRDRHLIANTHIDVDGDRATATSDWYLVAPPVGEGWQIVQAGRYADELVHRDGRWVFARREIQIAPR